MRSPTKEPRRELFDVSMHDPLNMSVHSRMGVWEKKVDESEREKQEHVKSQQVSNNRNMDTIVIAWNALGPVYIDRYRQHCDDARNTTLNKNNGFAPKWVATPDSIVFNKSSIASVIAALRMTLGVNGSLYYR